MAFKVFTNRFVQYPNRRKLTLVAGTTDVYDMAREEGTVFEEGVMFNEANMGEMQDEIVNYVEGTVLWTNPSPTSSFAGKTVTLSEAIEGFQKYQVVGNLANTGGNATIQVSTEKIDVGLRAWFNKVVNKNYAREITAASGTSVTFSDAYIYEFSGTNTLSNTSMIPIQIIGYK